MRDSFFIKNGSFRLWAIGILFLLPIFTAIICISIGRINISIFEIFKILKSIFFEKIETTNQTVIVNLRIPRIICACIIGAGLSLSGATFQSLFSNSLATPDILGVTSGTSLGAIIGIIFSLKMFSVQLLALVFGLFTVWLTLKLSGKEKQSIITLILSGIIISALFNAVGALLKYTADPLDKLPEITYWLMGSFTAITYKSLLISTPLILIGIIIIYLLRWQLNILSLSEDEAKSSGIDVKKIRIVFIMASTLITSSCVAMCGQIGWVGLLIPHCARMFVGSNNRFVIPVSISMGASFMIIIDTFSRTISKLELPLSILTAIIGAPLFISLLKKSKRSY